MAKEPERRFLLEDGFDPATVATATATIGQRYLRDAGSWTVAAVARGIDGRPAIAMRRGGEEHAIPIDGEAYEDLLTSCVDVDGAGGRLRDAGEWAIRLRRATRDGDTRLLLTLKRPETRTTNDEHEVALTAAAYHALAPSCGPEVLKARRLVPHGGRIWEVDEFLHQDPDPPALAEVELGHEDDALEIPSWAGREVTGERWYSNAAIAERLDAGARGDGR